MNDLFLTILILSIICSIIIVFVAVLDKLFHKSYSRQWKYIIWAIISLRLIIPIKIDIIDIPAPINLNQLITNAVSGDHDNSHSATNTLAINDNMDVNSDSMSVDTTFKDRTEIETMRPAGNPGRQNTISNLKSVSHPVPVQSVMGTISIIWIIGAIAFLIYHVLAYTHYKRNLFRWSNIIENQDILEQFHQLQSELNIKRNIRILTSSQLSTPILIGFLKPCIILPIENFTKEQYQFILKHELIHYKHQDLLYKIILLIANALHWFNPLIHYMVYLANIDMELYCDETLIAREDRTYRENYSMTLLKIMTSSMKNHSVLLSTNFSSKKEHVKKRFHQIMNAKPTKKGICFVAVMICLIVLMGNVFSWFGQEKVSKAGITDKPGNVVSTNTNSDQRQVINSNIADNTVSQWEDTQHILVLGIDANDTETKARADSILIVSVNPETKKISLISLLRDMYLELPNGEKDKLSSIYQIGGAELMKKTIESNFDLTIHNTVTVNMKAFEKIIDSIGGVEVELSGKEAEYLNKTNYISNKKYRTVVAGKQMLNGNQALGYVRVRKVPTLQGEREDVGRTARLRSVLMTVIKECSNQDIMELTKLLKDVLPYAITDLSAEQFLSYLKVVLENEFQTDTFVIPVEGSYTQDVKDGMSVLEPDLKANIEVLKQAFNK